MDQQMDFSEVVACLISRFGENQPHGGVVYNSPCTLEKGTLFIDSYGRGCVHNSVFNPYREKLVRQGRWNRPMPFPAEILSIVRALSTGGYDRVVWGVKSEPFPWMDCKYGVAKTIARLLARLCAKPVNIITSSDLISRTDYMSVLSEIPHLTLKMRTVVLGRHLKNRTVAKRSGNDPFDGVARNTGYPYSSPAERFLRFAEPGAPSLKRRLDALEKLEKNGFRVKRVSVSLYARTGGAR